MSHNNNSPNELTKLAQKLLRMEKNWKDREMTCEQRLGWKTIHM